MEDPIGAAKHVRRTRQAIAADGTWMIVEPFASDKTEENHNIVGRVFYSASTMLCVPHSLSMRGPALGAQAKDSCGATVNVAPQAVVVGMCRE